MKTVLLGIGGLGTTEIILVVAVILLMFGGKKIPELMKGLGRGMKEFKDASKGVETPENDKK
jgi:sec-independent protein translocase protein TatA